MSERHTISVLLENEAGALARVTSLFAQRGYNIESLTVAPTDDETISRITILTGGDSIKIKSIVNHLNRLIEIIEIINLTETKSIEREAALIKVATTEDHLSEVKEILEKSKLLSRSLKVRDKVCIMELLGTREEVDDLISALGNKTDILEVVRSGVLGIAQ